MTDRVIFRKWKDTEDIIAFLPDDPANYGYCMAYEHVGQHGEADYYGLLDITVPATPEEYQDLLEELQSIGYDLKVYRRLQYKKIDCPDCHGKGWFFDGQYTRLCGLCKRT